MPSEQTPSIIQVPNMWCKFLTYLLTKVQMGLAFALCFWLWGGDAQAHARLFLERRYLLQVSKILLK